MVTPGNGRDSLRPLVGSATYTYDPLNRLKSASTTGADCTMVNGFSKNWGESFNIDAWGNLLGITPSKCSAENLSVTVGTKNWITTSGYGYDAAGNMTLDGQGHSPVYDGENRIKTVAGVNYTYDGDGKRVKKDSGKLYWTGTGSDPLDQSDLSGNMTEEYVFFNGKRIARVDLTSSLVSQAGWTVTYVDSQETGCASGQAVKAIDGNSSTMWHTQYCNGAPPPPHEVQINLGATYTLNGFQYLPRQDGSACGWIRQYEFYVSTDGVNWGTAVATGTFDYTGYTAQCPGPGAGVPPARQISFPSTVGHYIRLRALSEMNGNPWTSAAEINVLASGNVHYYFSDHLGSASVITNATGTTIEQESDYYPYGGERVLTSGLNNYKFTGKERDAESGLDSFPARYYGSTMGRWMSPDPLGGHLEDPQTLNRYAYVRNNPLSLTDPTGLDFYLQCTHTDKNAETCQQQQVGTDKNGQAKMAWVQGVTNDGQFSATRIGNDDNGNLVDKTTGTGSYTGTVDSYGVHFSQNGGAASSGVFVNGTDATMIHGNGDYAAFNFTFTNSKLEAGQTAAGTFTFSGTLSQAREAFTRLGYQYWPIGTHWGSDEYRSRGEPNTGANSGHFSLHRVYLEPKNGVPQVGGDVHFGEHNPMFSPATHYGEFRR